MVFTGVYVSIGIVDSHYGNNSLVLSLWVSCKGGDDELDAAPVVIR